MELFIINFKDKAIEDPQQVGLKNAGLGKLSLQYGNRGIKVPQGFAITIAAYNYFKKHNNLDAQLTDIISGLDTEDFSNLSDISLQARKIIINSKFPKDLEQTILSSYESLSPVKDYGVAVRSSAAQPCIMSPDSYLNISGPIALLYAIKCCYASLYTEDFLRTTQQPPDISVGIQQMVRADLACSGIAGSDAQNICIEGSWGLGQDFAANLITPDRFIIPKNAIGNNSAIIKHLGSKSRMLVYNDLAAGTNSTTGKSTAGEMREQFILSDADITTLSLQVQEIERFANHHVMVEWARDGLSNQIYIVQAQEYEPIKVTAS